MPSVNQLPFDFSLESTFSLDEFIGSSLNSELLSLVEGDSSLPEPFYFIWGREGVGKSHFLQGLCQTRNNSVYVPLSKFSDYGPEILDGLDNMDLVCLDDIECFLDDKEKEEALFKFFNLIRERGNCLFVAASSSPRSLATQLADLSSRLAWGVIYQLHQLEDVDKLVALKQRVVKKGIPLSDEVLDYIFLRSPRSMTALFEVLDTLDQLSLAEKRRITIPFVKEIMDW